ncbi:hypothetical protein ACLRGI_10300 [Paenarthrobacter nitroguajacolicus]|uniref:hypothetical protein n=1 Tax=Paenarthrobacter nitroguajacolicus TaxID=211146 RepID=UPI003AE08897
MTTDADILAALEGRPNAKEQTARYSVLDILNGGPTATERAHRNAVLEALGVPTLREAAAGELPLQSRGGELEAVSIWAAKGAAETSLKSLAEAIMRTDGTKGIYLAEAEAKQIADEAYAVAAKSTPYEEERQQAVARVAAKLAEVLTRKHARESTPKQDPANPTPKAKPATPRVTRGAITGDVINYY